MSDALEQASLIMVPSGYEDGTLGSLKPTDGSGDFTFSRGSDISATRVNEDGYIEKGYENLLYPSNDFSVWNKTRTSVTSGQAGYDGSNDAWLLEAIVTSQCWISKSHSATGICSLSVYAKANTATGILVAVGGTSGTGYARFDLTNGVTGSVVGNGVASSIESVGDGWYRCSMFTTNTTITLPYIYVIDDVSTSNVTAGNSIYIQDAQINQGMVSYPYVETTTAPVAGGILEDMPRLDYTDSSCPALLLELQRTNLIRHSEYFLGENNWFGGLGLTFGYDSSILNPENYYGCTTAIGNHLKRYSVINGVSVGTKLSYSIFAKSNSNANFTFGGIAGEESATFNINAGTLISQGSSVDSYDIVDYSNGWRKYVVNTTFQDAIGNGQVYVNISWNDAIEPAYLYGLQLEQDATYPTSYIPTYGTSQTRLVETLASAIDIGSFTSNYNTLFFDWGDMEGKSTFNRDIVRGWATMDNSFPVFRIVSINDGVIRYQVYASGGVSLSANYTCTTRDKAALVLNGLNSKLFINGLPVATFSIDVQQGLRKFNYNGLSRNVTNQFTIFPTALSDDECIALTTIS